MRERWFPSVIPGKRARPLYPSSGERRLRACVRGNRCASTRETRSPVLATCYCMPCHGPPGSRPFQGISGGLGTRDGGPCLLCKCLPLAAREVASSRTIPSYGRFILFMGCSRVSGKPRARSFRLLATLAFALHIIFCRP